MIHNVHQLTNDERDHIKNHTCTCSLDSWIMLTLLVLRIFI